MFPSANKQLNQASCNCVSSGQLTVPSIISAAISLGQNMDSVNTSPVVPRTHEIQLRVRYQETDAQGRVHHSNYFNYFEVARVEMLRVSGRSYRQLECDGIRLVVTQISCQYFRGATDDDLLTIRISVTQTKGTRIFHHYDVFLDEELVAEGDSVVAAIDTTGKVVRLPRWLRV